MWLTFITFGNICFKKKISWMKFATFRTVSTDTFGSKATMWFEHCSAVYYNLLADMICLRWTEAESLDLFLIIYHLQILLSSFMCPLWITYWCHPIIRLPSVLWHCWLGGRKGIRPVKNWVVGCWHSYLSGARCRLAYGPADAIATHCLLLQ